MRAFAAILVGLLLVGCRRRSEVERSPEDRAPVKSPPKFVVLARELGLPGGFFFGGAFVVQSTEFRAFDLTTFAGTTVLKELPLPDVGEKVVCGADEKEILCVLERASAELEPNLFDALDGKPKKLAFIPGHSAEILADATDWYVRRKSATLGPADWGEIVGISRLSAGRRSVASAPELVAFAIDGDYVYWLEGQRDSKVFRKKKLGGPTELVTAVPEPGDIFVRGAHVHHRSAAGVIRRAKKEGGALEETGITGVETLGSDEAGFCWCTQGPAPRVFCRGADDVSRELLLPAKARCEWIAISRSHVVVQAEGAMWLAARP